MSAKRKNSLSARIKSDHWNKALAEIIAGFCHDLNAALTVVRGSLDLMKVQRRIKPHEREQLHEAAEASLSNAIHIVRGMLGLVRYYESADDSNFRMSATAIKHDLRSLLRPEASKARVRLKIATGQLSKNFTIPKVLLRHIVLPLAINSIEACETFKLKGRGLVYTRIRHEKVQGIVVIEVSDNGPGWPKSTSEIQKEMRSGRCNSKKGANRGWGLANLHRLVRRLGGECFIRERRTGGAEVEVRLPANNLCG